MSTLAVAQALTTNIEPQTQWIALYADRDGVIQTQQFLSWYRGLSAVPIVVMDPPEC